MRTMLVGVLAAVLFFGTESARAVSVSEGQSEGSAAPTSPDVLAGDRDRILSELPGPPPPAQPSERQTALLSRDGESSGSALPASVLPVSLSYPGAVDAAIAGLLDLRMSTDTTSGDRVVVEARIRAMYAAKGPASPRTSVTAASRQNTPASSTDGGAKRSHAPVAASQWRLSRAGDLQILPPPSLLITLALGNLVFLLPWRRATG